MNNTPRERFRKTLDISTGVSELLADSNTSYISWLESELAAVTEQLKETQKHLKDANRGAEINAHALRINADKLIAVTEQRDAVTLRLGDTQVRMFDAERQRDRLAEALKQIQGVGLVAVDAFDELDRIGEIAAEALQSLKEP